MTGILVPMAQFMAVAALGIVGFVYLALVVGDWMEFGRYSVYWYARPLKCIFAYIATLVAYIIIYTYVAALVLAHFGG